MVDTLGDMRFDRGSLGATMVGMRTRNVGRCILRRGWGMRFVALFSLWSELHPRILGEMIARDSVTVSADERRRCVAGVGIILAYQYINKRNGDRIGLSVSLTPCSRIT